jgi:hypothetical protein
MTAGWAKARSEPVIGPAKGGVGFAYPLLPFFGLTMKLGPVANWGLNKRE